MSLAWPTIIQAWSSCAQHPYERQSLQQLQQALPRGNNAELRACARTGLPYFVVNRRASEEVITAVRPALRACFSGVEHVVVALLAMGHSGAQSQVVGKYLWAPASLVLLAGRYYGSDLPSLPHRWALPRDWPIPMSQYCLPCTVADTHDLRTGLVDHVALCRPLVSQGALYDGATLAPFAVSNDCGDLESLVRRRWTTPLHAMSALYWLQNPTGSHAGFLRNIAGVLSVLGWATRLKDLMSAETGGLWNGFVTTTSYSTQVLFSDVGRANTAGLVMKKGWLNMVLETLGGQSSGCMQEESYAAEDALLMAAGGRKGIATVTVGSQSFQLEAHYFPPETCSAWAWLNAGSVQQHIPHASLQEAA